MKKVFFSLVIIFSLTQTVSHAQGFHLGIKAGTNNTLLTGNSFSGGFNWNFMAGAFAEINFTSKWGIEPELLCSARCLLKQPVTFLRNISRE